MGVSVIIGVAAGAAVGAAASAIAGGDPLKGALLGGFTGGIGATFAPAASAALGMQSVNATSAIMGGVGGGALAYMAGAKEKAIKQQQAKMRAQMEALKIEEHKLKAFTFEYKKRFEEAKRRITPLTTIDERETRLNLAQIFFEKMDSYDPQEIVDAFKEGGALA